MAVVLQDWASYALDALRAAGHRQGGARRAVVAYLGDMTCCVSAQEIFDGIRGRGDQVGIASVYRVVEQLAELKLVQRIDTGDGTSRFETVLPGGEHHHHLICSVCGRVEPFSDEALERALGRAADRIGYAMDTHDVVLRGTCNDCRSPVDVVTGASRR